MGVSQLAMIWLPDGISPSFPIYMSNIFIMILIYFPWYSLTYNDVGFFNGKIH